ncbi:MAG: hypothetical protein HY657_11170 [Acidobacteria bacterium]|nr:hypothetical protein [Acidobacteriota bacterium]
MAHLATDLAVTLPEDRPGMLAKALGAVGSSGINIDGYAEMDGVVHVLTTQLDATRRALGQAGFRVVTEQPVLLVPIADTPGSAARVFQRIADAKINVQFSYLATGNRLVIGASDLEAVKRALDG